MVEHYSINRSLLKEIVLEQKQAFAESDKGVLRVQLSEISKTLNTHEITIITGIRRCGKSTLLRQLAEQIGLDNIHFLSFEDERLVSFDFNAFNLLLEIFYEVNDKQTIFLFDEIQVVANWERFIRRLHDQGNKIVITGSNASLLSRELGTKLTGRHIDIELFPFSFSEYLVFKNCEFNPNDIFITEKRAILQKWFNSYLTEGGMPNYLKYQDRKLLVGTYEDILYRDIFQRYKINETRLFRELSLYLFSNITSSISYNQLKIHFNFGSTNTVINYISYLEDSYLLFLVNAFSPTYKKQVNSPKKLYAISNAFIDQIGFHLLDNTGVLLENLVFLHLRQHYRYIFYYKTKNNLEVDFLVYNQPKESILIQVTYSLTDPRTREQELRALTTALSELQLKQGLILTTSETEEIVLDDLCIKIQPIYQWLLQDSCVANKIKYIDNPN